MSYKKSMISFMSSTGEDCVAGYFYEPVGVSPRGIVQVSHGMCEYIERYADFAEFLCGNGFILCGNDHLGHGNTAKDMNSLGFTASGGGARYLVEDVRNMSNYAKKKFPGLPLILLGHSMGSFVARQVIAKYGEDYAGAMILGTGGPEMPAKLGKAVAKTIILFNSEKKRSQTVAKLVFAGYNKHYPKEDRDRFFSWLTRDKKVVGEYENDPKCNFVFTAIGFYDLFDLLDGVSRKDWAGKVPSGLPILIASGEEDPVGGYGKGVRTVYERLCRAGVENVELKLYPSDRHELLHELDRDVVYADLLGWIEKTLA